MCCGCCCYSREENIPLIDMLDCSEITGQQHRHRATSFLPITRTSINEQRESEAPRKNSISAMHSSFGEILVEEIKDRDEKKLMFATDRKTQSQFYLRGNPVSLVATNIPSFMGGRSNPWMASEKFEMALLDHEQDELEIADLPLTKKQSKGDGLLEFCAAENMVEMTLDRCKRVGQAGGPICIRFKRQETQFIAYINVDGEFFKVRNPVSLTLRLANWLNNGSISILHRAKPTKQ